MFRSWVRGRYGPFSAFIGVKLQLSHATFPWSLEGEQRCLAPKALATTVKKLKKHAGATVLPAFPSPVSRNSDLGQYQIHTTTTTTTTHTLFSNPPHPITTDHQNNNPLGLFFPSSPSFLSFPCASASLTFCLVPFPRSWAPGRVKSPTAANRMILMEPKSAFPIAYPALTRPLRTSVQ